MREGGGIPVDCMQSNFSSYILLHYCTSFYNIVWWMYNIALLSLLAIALIMQKLLLNLNPSFNPNHTLNPNFLLNQNLNHNPKPSNSMLLVISVLEQLLQRQMLHYRNDTCISNIFF